MNIAELSVAAKEVLTLLGKYHNAPHREMLIDPVLFAYLRGKHPPVERQHYVYRYGSERPQRIDFRTGGTNPVVLEFAVRPPVGGGHLLGSQNTSELRKLCRVTRTSARLRALLLMDLYHEPIERKNLQATYAAVNAGRGRFQRNPVRVVYVHPDLSYSFAWDPYRT